MGGGGSAYLAIGRCLFGGRGRAAGAGDGQALAPFGDGGVLRELAQELFVRGGGLGPAALAEQAIGALGQRLLAGGGLRRERRRGGRRGGRRRSAGRGGRGWRDGPTR